jgi:dihydrofolate reductase
MRKIICYIAISLDGKIADSKGGVEWLEKIPNPEKSDYGYQAFFGSIDCTIMGNATYRQILGFDVEFPYKSTDNYVITRDKTLSKDQHVTYISESHKETIARLKNAKGKNIWCVGGGGLISFLINHGLLDEFRIFIMPVLLGSGIPIINELLEHCFLELMSTKTHSSGVLELSYKVAKK